MGVTGTDVSAVIIEGTRRRFDPLEARQTRAALPHDPQVTPPRILPCEPHHQLDDLTN